MNTINNNQGIGTQHLPSNGTPLNQNTNQSKNNNSEKIETVDYTPASDEKLRLAELKDSIKTGSYKVNFESVAEKILTSGDL